jgi:hypothetical protein
MTNKQNEMAVGSARFILEDLNELGREKLAELTGLPLGVIVAAWENIFPERQMTPPREPRTSRPKRIIN